MGSKVKDFWVKPKDLPLTLKELTFGYTDDKGTKREYKVSPKDNLYSFHAFIQALMVAKKKNLLPWTMKAIRKVKDKLNIVNPKDAVQMEMDLKVARNFHQEQKFPWEV